MSYSGLVLHGDHVRDHVEQAQEGERQGFSGGWVTEVNEPDAITVLAAVAASTKRFGIGTGILPIGLRGDTVHDCIALGQALVESLDGRPAAILASSDLSHNMPESRARDGDLRALQAIRDMDTEKLTALVGPGGVNMCGPGAVVAMISAMSTAGATAVRVLAYGTTADTMGESSSVVGYAAAAARPMA